VAATQEGQDNASPCLVLDQLFGSRIGVGNVELRFPLIQALVVGGGLGVPPIEGFAFYDAGIAWGEGTPPGVDPGLQPEPIERELLSSAGVGGRINLFGYMVIEAVYVRPFTGERGWHWQFAIQPGF
jgi:outer membrane protein assembly factor BamA